MTFTAVLILSPDALLVRLIDCDVWTLLFWRGLLTGCMQALFLALVFRRQFLQAFRNIGRTGMLSAAMVAVGSLLFVNSIKHTTAANTLIIIAATPLVSSLLSTLFLKETPPRRTRVAVTVCFVGILLLLSGSLSGGLLFGDLLALGATLTWGGNLVVLRSGRHVNMIPANLLGNLLVVPMALLAGADPAAVSGQDVGLLLLLGGLVLPVSFTLITLAPRYLSAPEVSLMLLVETTFGPLWVWLVLAEVPHARTLLAGLLIIGTLVVHTLLTLKAQKPASAEAG